MKYSTIINFFIFIGLLLIAGGIYHYWRTNQFIARSIEVSGTVIRLEKTSSSNYKPIVEYTDHQGVKRTLFSNGSSSPPRFFEGESVSVLYDPNDPKYPVKAKINSTFTLRFASYFFVIFGLSWMIIALLAKYIASKGGVIYFDNKNNN